MFQQFTRGRVSVAKDESASQRVSRLVSVDRLGVVHIELRWSSSDSLIITSEWWLLQERINDEKYFIAFIAFNIETLAGRCPTGPPWNSHIGNVGPV